MIYHNINGKVIGHMDATIHASDLTFRRGYGVFDFLRVLDGIPVFLEDHLDRFESSAAHLRLKLPVSRDVLRQRIHELILLNHTEEAGIQLFLTGGYSMDGFNPVEPNLVILQVALPKPAPDHYQTGIKLMTYPYQRDFPEAKTTNYQMAVYLNYDMQQRGIQDVLYHHNGKALETSRSNIFIVKDGRIFTPDKQILAGVTRKHVMSLMADRLEVRSINLTDVWQADEVFVSSTTKGALPVAQIDDHVFSVGPVSKTVMEHFSSLVQQHVQSKHTRQGNTAVPS